MTEDLRDPASRARKNLTTILSRLQSVGQVEVAKKLNVSESLISKWKSEDAERVAEILAHLGLKIVPESLRCYEPRQLEAILALAKARLERIESPQELEWEGD